MKLFNILAAAAFAEDFAEDGFTTFDASKGDGIHLADQDGEHNSNRPSWIQIDQRWKDFNTRTDAIFESLFPELLVDADFIANRQLQKQEDEDLCVGGRDPTGFKVKCGDIDPITGFREFVRTKWMTPSRKMNQIKLMSFWLSPAQNRDFSKFCNYGCYCLPGGVENFSERGYGQPVDDIDKTCKAFQQCYECAKLGSDNIAGDEQCDGAGIKYKYRLVSYNDDRREVKCMDNPVNQGCARNICECDKRYAESMAAHEDQWSVNFHTMRNDGAWKYNEQCQKGQKGQFGRPETCCGTEFPDMIPKQTGKQCCGYRPFDPAGARKCCEGNKLRSEC